MKKLLLSLLCLAGLSATAQTYELVKEVTAEDLGSSQYILIGLNKSKNTYQVAGAFDTKYFTAIDVTVDATKGTCDITNVSGVEVFTIEAGSEAKSYSIKTSNNKFVNFTGTSNQNMTLVDNKAKASSFTLSFSADGNAEFVNCNYTGRGLKYNASQPRFSNYATGNQTYGFLYKLSNASKKEVATPQFSVAQGEVEAGTQVAIDCATPSAEIYYTLDGTTPDNTSIHYNGAITINETTTVKAIAYLGGKDSNVATATYTVVPLDSFEDVLGFANGTAFKMGTDLTVVYVPESDTRYYYVYADGKYSVLYKKNLGLKTGEVVKKGWEGEMTYYKGLPELVPTASTLATTGETGTIPAPAVVDAADVTNAYINNIIVIKNVVFAAATESATNVNFTGTVGATELTFRNSYKTASVEAGTYDVTCVVSTFDNEAGTTSLGTVLQLIPTKYEKATTGIDDIEAEGNVAPVYYNLQGVRVANPENGLFIEVRGNKAVKVIK